MPFFDRFNKTVLSKKVIRKKAIRIFLKRIKFLIILGQVLTDQW